jgi:hypothetical protein
MNYVKVINKAEILLYSSLISIMSGINRLRDPEQDLSADIAKEITRVNSIPADEIDPIPAKSAAINWQAVQQTVLGLVLWMTLGLAAGFLMGMLKHG